MPKRSLIDDVRLRYSYSDHGPPILFGNADIRRMLNLAQAGKNDVVFDLGCGWAQNLIIAATEFDAKKCFGIERLKRRYLKAKERVRDWPLSDKITIFQGQFEDLIEGKSEEAKIEAATIILYLVESDKEFVDQLSKKLQEGCRLVYYYNALIPEIIPDVVNHPFYVSIFPFKRPSSELDWLKSIVQKKESSLIQDKEPSAEELWDELYHDYNIVELGRRDVTEYQKRLKHMIK